jgi:hypothetical protein
MARYQHRRRRRSSTLTRIALIALVLVVAAGASLVAFRVQLAEFGLKAALESNGLGPVQLEVKQLGLSSTRLGPIALGNTALHVEQIIAEYDLIPALLEDSLFSLEISGLHLKGEWKEHGLSFGPLDRLFDGSERNNETRDAGTSGEKTGAAQSEDDPGTASPGLGTVRISDAKLTVAGLQAPLIAEFNLVLDAQTDTIPLDLNGTVSGPGLNGSVVWDGIIDTADLAASNGAGALQLKAAAFALPGTEQIFTANVDVTTTLGDGAFNVSLTDTLELQMPWPDIALPFEVSEQTIPTLSLALRSQAEEAHLVSVTKAGDEITGRTDVTLTWDSPVGTGQMDLAGWVVLGADNLPQDFRFDRLSLAVHEVPSPFGIADVTLVADGLRGPIAVAQGPIEIEVAVKTGALGDIRYGGVDLTSDGVFRLDGLSLALDLNTLNGTVSDMRYGDLARFEETLDVNLSPDARNTQTVTTVFGADGSATLTFDLGVGVTSGTVIFGLEDPIMNGKAAFPTLSLEGFWVTGDDGLDIQINGTSGSLLSSKGNVTTLTFESFVAADTVEGVLKGQLTLDPARDPSRPGLPFESDFSLADGQLVMTGTAALPRDQTLGRFSVAYNLEQEGGYAATSIGPLLFGGSDLRPSDLAPLGLPLTLLSGEVYAETTFRLGTSDVAELGSVLVRDLEVETGDYRFQRINTAIELSEVWPPKTSDNQQLAIGLMQAGVPLTNIVATYALSSADAIDISSLSMDLAGGTISSDALAFRLDGSDSIATFIVNDVQLDQLAALSGLPGLTATGVLSGTIPVRLVPGDAIVENGQLSTIAPGSIRYTPDASTAAVAESQSGYGLALQALEDFQYENLALTVNGSLSKDLEVGLQLKGNNPGLYDGYPIEFNLNLSGELANVIQGSLTGYRVPETIKRQLMEFPPTR